ncbi:DMT family transporter [Halegenticoccus tardaugens]|uniref:DMT family transporter n=1 Tax=Halegenticoccus tardaugens TaxID=2071624 RepID=UPI00100A5AB3|nr:DMT family transporter [Halegenticoccus tardaugens]
MDIGIAYSVVAAFVWGGYLFGLKRYFDDYPATALSVLVYGFAIVWYLPFAAATLPGGAVADAVSNATLATAGVVLVTVVSIAVALVVFLWALEVGEVSYVAPINKIVPVFVLPIEIGLLGAHLTPVQLVGVLVATLAVYVANYRSGSLLAPIRKAATSRAAQLALASAACFAVGDIGKRLALQDLGLPLQAWVLVLLGGVLVVLLPAALRSWPETVRRDAPKLAAAGAAVAVGEHVTSLAFAAVPASIASPVINTQAIVAVVLGGIVLREEAFRLRLGAAVLAVVGVSLIAL